MRTFLLPSAVLLFGILPGSARSNEEANAIIDKAVEAHGGLETLKKLEKKAIFSSAKGKVYQFGEADIEVETMAMNPDKLKVVTETEVMGQPIKQVQIFNGDEYALLVNGRDVSGLLGDGFAKEVREQLYQEKLAGLALLKDSSVKLSPLGEVAVAGKPALGVRVSSQGHRDVSMFFDKQSGMLVKVEARVLDLQTQQEVTQARLLSHYVDREGVKQPSKIVIEKDGKKFVEMEIIEIKYLDEIDDSEFALP